MIRAFFYLIEKQKTITILLKNLSTWLTDCTQRHRKVLFELSVSFELNHNCF